MSIFRLIEDPDDARLEAYRDIRERDLVGRLGLFIAEGELVVRALAKSPHHRLHSVLCLEERAGRLADVVAQAPEGVPAYRVGRAVLDRVAGFPVHRGILAIGQRAADPGVEATLSAMQSRALVLVLVGIANHDNVGALFRNAAAFGVSAVLLDHACCDPLYRKAIRVSVGHALTVPFSRGGSAGAVLETLDRHGFDLVALSPRGAAALDRHTWRPRTALIVGAEGSGLPPAILQRARPVAIPMAADIDSLNVATAAAIALHEARRRIDPRRRK